MLAARPQPAIDLSAEPSVRWAHGAIVAIAVSTSLIAVVRLIPLLVAGHGLFADWTVLWTAARFDDVYDAERITRAQEWILGAAPTLRPFAYPPTMLLLVKMLAPFNYGWALALWISASIAAFGGALWLYGKRAMLAAFSPMVGLSILVGQASLLLGAVIAMGVALLSHRPLLAGALLGIVAAAKPQLAILCPLALVSGRHWNAVLAAGVAFLAIVLGSLLLGPHLWLEWLGSLDDFLEEVQAPHFHQTNMAPGFAFTPFGIAAVWYVWSRSQSAELRLIALVGGACLSVPYMMNYDMVAMAPAAAAMLLHRDWRVWLVGLFGFVVLWASPFIVTCGAALLAYRDPRCRPA